MKSVVWVSDRTELKSIDINTVGAAFLNESGREGNFSWRPGDFSARFSADPLEGVYVKSSNSAVSGAWVRAYEGPVSAKWFGAKGTGVGNDTQAIQGAINLVESLGVGNYWSTYFGEVVLPSGDYPVTGLVVKRPIVFGGAGAQSCSISLLNGSNANVVTLKAPEAQIPVSDTFRYSARLKGFAINGNAGGQTGTSNGIYIENSSYDISARYDGSALIEDVIVRATKDVGIYIGINRNYGAMRCVAVVYCRIGVQNNAYDWRITDCDFGNSSGPAYWQFMAGATHIIGTNVYMSSNDSGLVISANVNAPCMISGCYIDSHAMNGVYVEGNGSPGTRHVISGNIFRDNSASVDDTYAHIFSKNLKGSSFMNNCFVSTNTSKRAAYLVYSDLSKNLVWSASYEATPGAGRPYVKAVCNDMSSLIS
ncbi:glycosyl hydrolase family 28-related protein [Pseudomonas sp. P5_152]|uniref:glycosyl hydrolase family 28-related protein n=1 Tax=Pseudomonas sp. P5_152 TaxID=3043442 RepID=UPI002A369336|nr:glycosyl hydrolase family 28-related protein [Pseudomonas sp. P5_152]MDX9668320.1 glycosyl hydrolase family 28-related protein [Pseudomonas sp. P5_152]